MRPEINWKKKKKPCKIPNKWSLNNMLLNNQWVTEEIKKKFLKSGKQMKMETQQSKIYGMQ